MAVVDPFDRPVTRVRISVTSACNFSCFYCHREGFLPNSSSEMRPEEIERIVRVMASLGVSRVKLTGGEPTVRPDIVEIVGRLASISEIIDLSMVTNGSRLAKLASELKEAGLDRINVSLPSLRPDRFAHITGVSLLSEVVSGIEAAASAEFSQLKINRVILRGINQDETEELIELARDLGAMVQLIQLEDADPESPLLKAYGFGLQDLIGLVKELGGKLVSIRDDMQNRLVFDVRGVKVEVVGPMGNPDFCARCTRIRITSDGRFKPCLFLEENTVDFLRAMRAGADNDTLKALYLRAISLRKPYFGWIIRVDEGVSEVGH
ncbi:MAG TPA: GTP 3',8-cyclase MoaA [Candidatus Korarchaeota archaeon]|nr:GTP 3',8-cyclase MoaA [Candidatus Korarchaeota archaeon]